MITLNLSDRLPCPGNHPGYSQEMGCAPDECFKCDRCLRIVPYCKGAADEMPDACDDCWYAVHKDDEW